MRAVFILPMSVTLPRVKKADKVVRLNLNVYRNLHHRTEYEVKKAFKPISGEPFKADHVIIRYTIHPGSRRKFDTMNIIAIVDKYFCDWMQSKKYIPDDDYKHVFHLAPKVVFSDTKKDCVKAEIIYKRC